ncbi:MAG: FecR family protein [Bacteroidales bacterium]|jgi:ferric-dicitrate binding protein FerR (iron transport regulator)
MITDELLFRFLNKETSKKEDRLIKDWLTEFPDQANRLNKLREFMVVGEQTADHEEILRDWNTLESKMEDQEDVRSFRRILPLRLARIAAVLLVLAGSALLWLYQGNNHVIRNNELIAKSVFLPDGTHIDLGPGSKLIYGKAFLEGNRVIRLSGEAFFDVSSDPEHPFTVIAGLAKIKVTGTRFVVNAKMASKEVEVTVKSGNVLFYNSDTMDKNSFRVGLVAGEIGIFYPGLNRMDKTRDPFYQTTP